MAATTMTRLVLTDDSGTPATPVGDGDAWDNAQLQVLQGYIDALVANDITFGGLVHSEGVGVHSWSGSSTGAQGILLRNTNSGTGAFAQYRLGNDQSAAMGGVTGFSTNYTSLGSAIADSVRLNNGRPGGAVIAADHASGPILFYAGGSSAAVHSIDATGVLNLQDGVRLNNIISPTQLTADTDNWNPSGLAAANVIRMTSDAARNLAGLVAQEDGRLVILINVGSFTITLEHDEGTSTAANRFYCPDSSDMPMQVNNATTLLYDGTSSRWRIVDLPNQT